MGKSKILVFENEQIIAKDLKATLTRMGYDVPETVSNGEYALDAVAKHRPDLILMDIMLDGDMDGIETATLIKSILNIPIIYLTAYADDKTFERAKITEHSAYILKPFEDRELQICIETTLYKSVMETKLKENEQRLSVTLASLGDAVITINEQQKINYVNPAAEILSGLSSAELLDKKFCSVFRIDGYNENEFFNHVINKNHVVKNSDSIVEIRPLRTKIFVSYTASPLYKHNKSISGLVLVLSDIQERKSAEAALQQEHELFEMTIKSVNDGVLVTNQESQIVVLNQATRLIIGDQVRVDIGDHLKPFLIGIASNGNEIYQTILHDVLDSGQIYALIVQTNLTNANGKQILLSMINSPIRKKNEHILGVLTILRDITNQKQIEDELQKANKLESLGLLAGGIAHDFNNLLVGAVGNLTATRIKLRDNIEANALIQKTENILLKASRLTHQLLTFSKGGIPIRKKISFKIILEETLGFSLSGTSVETVINIDSNLQIVEGDAGQLEQVFNNIILNAVQAMNGKGMITVSAHNVELSEHNNPTNLTNGQYVLIEFADNGPGIPSEIISKIFDPFFTTKETGNGLGLAIVYSIIAKHDGTIVVDSQPGKGTSFKIYLPSNPEFTEEIPNNYRSGDRLTNEPTRIMLMDDDQTIREVFEVVLKEFNFDVLFASNGEEAVKVYTENMNANPIKAVILDLTIVGGMGGKDTIKALTEIDPNVKAIVSSGYSNDPIMANYEDYGFKGVLAKPYNFEELHQLIITILRNE